MAKAILLIHSFASRGDEPIQVMKEMAGLAKLCNSPSTPTFTPPISDEDEIKIHIQNTANVQIFHFAGHAVGNYLITGECRVDMRFFSTLLVEYGKTIRLVFLNACKTEDIADNLKKAGIPTVIATTIPVRDEYAIRFASIFYTHFIKEKNTVDKALALAHATINSRAATPTPANDPNPASDAPQDYVLINPDTGELQGHLLDKKKAEEMGFQTDDEASTKSATATDAGAERGQNIKRKSDKYDPLNIYKVFGNGGSSFDEWGEGEASATSTDLDKKAPQDLGLQEDAYLLCDRDDQAKRLFQCVQGILYDRPMMPPQKPWRTKLFGLPPEKIVPTKQPLFVFLNSSFQNGPYDFLARFEKYILKLHWPQNTLPISDLDFPSVDDFQAGNKPLATLRGIYDNHLMSIKSGENFEKDLLFVTRHELPSDVWSEGYEAFFIDFIEKESLAFQKDLKRLIIICWLQYDDEGETFENAKKYDALFCKLESKFSDRVFHFCDFPLVKKMDVVRWHQDLFGPPTLNPAKYKFGADMAFVDASEILLKIIKDRHG